MRRSVLERHNCYLEGGAIFGCRGSVVQRFRERRMDQVDKAEERTASGKMMEAEEAGGEAQAEKCECCGLVEECTPAYVARVKEIFCGRWVCGLCGEAVQEEHHRIGGGAAAMEEALRSHTELCLQFNELRRLNPAICLADAMRQLLRLPHPSSPPSSSRSSACLPATRTRFLL